MKLSLEFLQQDMDRAVEIICGQLEKSLGAELIREGSPEVFKKVRGQDLWGFKYWIKQYSGWYMGIRFNFDAQEGGSLYSVDLYNGDQYRPTDSFETWDISTVKALKEIEYMMAPEIVTFQELLATEAEFHGVLWSPNENLYDFRTGNLVADHANIVFNALPEFFSGNWDMEDRQHGWNREGDLPIVWTLLYRDAKKFIRSYPDGELMVEGQQGTLRYRANDAWEFVHREMSDMIIDAINHGDLSVYDYMHDPGTYLDPQIMKGYVNHPGMKSAIYKTVVQGFGLKPSGAYSEELQRDAGEFVVGIKAMYCEFMGTRYSFPNFIKHFGEIK